MKAEMNFLKTENLKTKTMKIKLVPVSGKSFILIALIVFSGFQMVSAQGQFQWGVKAGMNASTQSEIGNICDNSNLVNGFSGGVVARYGLGEWLGVSSGIDFQMKGMKSDKSGMNFTNRLNYLVIPVKAEFSDGNIGFKEGQRLFFATGPYAGYLLGAKQTKDGVKVSMDNYQDFDFGWNFELGYRIPIMKSKAIQFSLNYDMGFSEVENNTDKQNKTASFNVTWLF